MTLFESDMHLIMSEDKEQDTMAYASWLKPLLERYFKMFSECADGYHEAGMLPFEPPSVLDSADPS
jgi:hypothetical protein